MLWWKSLDNQHLTGAGGCGGLSVTCHGKLEGRGNSGTGVALQPQVLQPQVLPQIGLNFNVFNGKKCFSLSLGPHVLMGLLSLQGNAAAVQQSQEQPARGTSTHLVQGASGGAGGAGNAW